MTKEALRRQSLACCEFRQNKEEWIHNEKCRLMLFLNDPKKIKSTIAAKVEKFLRPKTIEQVNDEVRILSDFEFATSHLWIERAYGKRRKR